MRTAVYPETPNKSLQLTFDPPPIFAVAKKQASPQTPMNSGVDAKERPSLDRQKGPL